MRHQAADGARTDQPAADPLRSRRYFLGGLAVGIIAMSATGLATVRLIESPGQVTARSAAPPRSVITAIARWEVLRNAITTQGTVRAARTIQVTASAPFADVVVTRVPVKVGQRIRPGRVIAEINGRPILLLRGRLPAYRDLHEGEHGPDVSQLQQNLEHLGFADFDAAGFFGPSTSLALSELYSHFGYTAPPFRRHRQARTVPQLPDVFLPMSEVSYLPARSALVVKVDARAGTVVGSGGAVLSLATGNPYVTGTLTSHQASQVRRGMSAEIASYAPPRSTDGTVTRVGPIASTAVPGYPVRVRAGRQLPQRLIGTRVRLTILAPETAGPVLVVPITSIVAATRARSAYVVRIGPGRRRRRVPILIGPRANGLVAVQSVRPGELRTGDRVLIGFGR